LDVVAALPFREARFQQYTARRRVVGFGASPYTVSGDGLAQEALPPELRRLRRKVADWRGLDENQFAHALVTEYRTGTPIGWHRDQPAYGIVVGISLGSPCRMRFRPIGAHDERRRVSVLELEPRSAYAMDGDIRWCWQHSIAPTAAFATRSHSGRCAIHPRTPCPAADTVGRSYNAACHRNGTIGRYYRCCRAAPLLHRSLNLRRDARRTERKCVAEL
jgi:alkylated DNA repair dioxygenase AlkB